MSLVRRRSLGKLVEPVPEAPDDMNRLILSYHVQAIVNCVEATGPQRPSLRMGEVYFLIPHSGKCIREPDPVLGHLSQGLCRSDFETWCLTSGATYGFTYIGLWRRQGATFQMGGRDYESSGLQGG